LNDELRRRGKVDEAFIVQENPDPTGVSHLQLIFHQERRTHGGTLRACVAALQLDDPFDAGEDAGLGLRRRRAGE
jgi:hypothetical protein